MLDSRYVLNSPSCIAEAVENDLIVINLVNGRYYNLRDEATQVWTALTRSVSPVELLQQNDWSDTHKRKFEEFLSFLLEEQLLVTTPDVDSQSEAVVVTLEHLENPFQVDVFTDMQEMLLLDPIHDADASIGWPHKA